MSAPQSMVIRAGGVFVLAASLLALSSCDEAPVPASVSGRSLEGPSNVSFVCLARVGDDVRGVPLDRCSEGRSSADAGVTIGVEDYASPHLLALLTQTTRGEVAVIDVSAGTLIDADPSVPGFTFLPVGARPAEIVSTPGGQATFVAVGESNRPGIFVLPSSAIPRGGVLRPAATLASWPACRLPVVPGPIAMLVDPPRSTGESSCANRKADRSIEPEGAPMLAVALPALGEVDILDAQALMELQPGSFDSCEAIIVNRIALAVDRSPGGGAPDAGDAGGSCPTSRQGLPAPHPTVLAGPSAPHPSALAYAADDGRLFVADDQSPVIHVLGGANPCELREQAPLLPTSVTDPSREVVTSALAVSPLTGEAQKDRWVYAVDFKGGTVMVFDVRPGATARTPLLVSAESRDLYAFPDRIHLPGVVRAVNFVRRDAPNAGALRATEGGTIPNGIRCNPETPNPDDPRSVLGAEYRTSADFKSGAGPRTLRGVFALVTLTSGEVAIVDVDDYDAPCRRLEDYANQPLLGCGSDPWSSLSTTNEVSCNAVEQHHVRSQYYYENNPIAGDYAPSMQAFPALHDKAGKAIPFGEDNPKLLGPAGLPDPPFPNVSVGGQMVEGGVSDAGNPSGADGEIVADAGRDDAIEPARDAMDTEAAPGIGEAGTAVVSPDPAVAQQNWVAFDLIEPRAHLQQTWTVTYEGQVANFKGLVGYFQCRTPNPDPTASTCDPPGYDFYDGSASFCARGVRGQDNVPRGQSGDTLHILDAIPGMRSAYWPGVTAACDYQRCTDAFGPPDEPTEARAFTIEQAYQDHLRLDATSVPDVPITCCFPSLVTYTVRAHQSWVVGGSAIGVQHHVVPDTAGANHCVDSCDPARALANSRAYELDPSVPPLRIDDTSEDGFYVFRNASMRFVIWKGALPTERDTAFSLDELGGFTRLSMSLVSPTTAVSPQTLVYVPPLGQLAVADGEPQGLVFIDLDRLSVVRPPIAGATGP